MQDVKSFLQSHDIAYEWHDHPAVYTVAEAAEKAGSVPGTRCKNLFLKSKNGSQGFFLLLVPAERRVDLKALGRTLGAELTFGNEAELRDLMGLTPGSVSPLGLINDHDCRVQLVVAEELIKADFLNIHPNTNTASITLAQAEFQKLLAALVHPPRIISIPYIV